MAIKLPSGFIITTTEPIDSRLVMTKAQMLAVVPGVMPNHYFTLCSEDNRIYIYDSTATPSATTGKFRPIEDFLDFSSEAAKAAIEAAIVNSSKIKEIDEKIGDAEKGTGLAGDVKVLQTDVATLKTDVTVLKQEVEDPTEGLKVKVQELKTEVNDLEPRVAKAESDITGIETWINNVKIEGGEIKATYNLTPTLTNVTASASNPTTISYKGSAVLTFVANTGYHLPDKIKVNNTEVVESDTGINCGNVIAKWIKASGRLELSSAAGDVAFIITGTTEV